MSDWLPTLSDELQRAALDPSHWQRALDSVSDTVGSLGAIFFNASTPLQQLPISTRLEEATKDYYANGWAERDERFQSVPRLFKYGICSDQDLFTPEHIAKSTFFQEFLARHGLRWGIQLAIRNDKSLWSFSLQRSIRQGPFFENEILDLRRLQRPLCDAVTIAQAIGFARIAGIADAWNSMDRACVILDGRHHILHYNEKAENLVKTLARSSRGRIGLIHPENDRRLSAIIANAHSVHEGPTITSLFDNAGSLHRVRAIKLRNWSKFTFSDADTLLLFDNDEVASISIDWLNEEFGLTRAEAKLALEVMKGHSLQAAARTLNITYETARSRMKMIFAKTASHRQAELVAKLNMLIVPIHEP